MRAGWGRAAVALALAGATGLSMAAGGHHAVDDAGLLDPGACKVESWFERSGAPARLLHAGVGCRVGPVELVAASEYERMGGGAGSQTSHSLQVKWASELATGFSAGLSVAPGWQSRARPRYQGATAVGLLTWEVRETVAVHANAGRDFVHGGADQSRGGLSIDWAFRDNWKVMAERYREQGGHFARAGLRWTPAKDWTVDFSRAVRLRGAGDSSWTVGLTREFDR